MALVVTFTVLLAVLVAAVAALAGYVFASRRTTGRLEAELERASGERHEAFLAALRLADTAGSHAAAETIYALRAETPRTEDERDEEIEQEILDDPLFQHLEDLADHDAGLLLDPLDAEATAV